jgi:1,6-anhydro-N-acetylmuramate kinase
MVRCLGLQTAAICCWKSGCMEAGSAWGPSTHVCYNNPGSWLDADIVQAKPGAMRDRKAGNLHWLHSQCRHDTPSSLANQLQIFSRTVIKHRTRQVVSKALLLNKWSLFDVACVPVWARMH